MKTISLVTFFAVFLFLFSTVDAQNGGTFEITQSVIAGGGQSSSGGAFSLDGTVGQSLAGNRLSNPPFSVTSGFWNFSPVAPTAARVTVGGRIRTAQGTGIRNASITLTGANGSVRTTYSTSFGYYQFTDVEIGNTYILTAQSRRFLLTEPTRVISVLENIADLDFIAGEEISK